MLVIYHPTFSWIEQTPQAFFSPPILSVANFTSGFPREGFFIAIDFLLLALNVCIILGIKARVSTLAYVIVSLIGLNYQYSFGTIQHNILPYAMLACMSFSGWGSELALVPDKATKFDSVSKSLSLLSVLICFGFFTAGFEKALYWIDVDFNKNGTAYWFYSGYCLGRNFLLAPFFKFLPFSLLKIFDVLAALFEVGAIVCLLASKKMWRIWLVSACMFHIFTTVFLNISFIWQSLVYVAFVDFSGLSNRVKSLAVKKSFVICFFSFLLFIIILRSRVILNYGSSTNIFLSDDSVEGTLFLALIIWLIVAFIIFNSIKKLNSARFGNS